ncbi:hypothetical protein HY311_00830 [Candidatus Nomurabacteria bacterium]|nr:hypothetical protein [Candidatus Nomurabacteria bacterium]
MISVYLNLIFNIKIFESSWVVLLGLTFLSLATILILWAQSTSRNLKKENISKANFSQGPYAYTRNPTHFGLFFLTLGFGMIVNSFFIMLFAFVAFIFEKIIFLNKQEKILAEKYGAPYLEYKKSVKF